MPKKITEMTGNHNQLIMIEPRLNRPTSVIVRAARMSDEP